MKRLIPFLSFLAVSCSIGTITALPARHSADEHAALLSSAPDNARARSNPYEGKPGAATAGRKLFLQHCAECHGKDGGGIGRAPSLHSLEVRQATSGQLEWFLRNGRLSRGMPSWSGLPPQRRWQIVAYLKSLR